MKLSRVLYFSLLVGLLYFQLLFELVGRKYRTPREAGPETQDDAYEEGCDTASYTPVAPAMVNTVVQQGGPVVTVREGLLR